MVIYWAIFIIFFILSLLDIPLRSDERKARKYLMGLMGLSVILIAGLRWDTGTDWENYLSFYNYVDSLGWLRTPMEPGYEIIVRLNKMLFGTYTSVLIFTATFIVATTYWFIFRYSPKPFLSLFILWGYSLVASGFGVRQDLAICLILISFYFIVRRDLLIYLLLIFLASSIHQSAIIFLPAYFIFQIKWNAYNLTLLGLGFLVMMFISSLFIDYLSAFYANDKMSFYLDPEMLKETSVSGLIRSILLKLIFFAIFIGHVRYHIDKKDNIYNGIFNIYFIGLLIYTLVSHIHPVMGRMSRYYEIFHVVLLPMALVKYKLPYRLIVLAIILLVSFMKFYIQMNSDTSGGYIPYETIFN